MAREKASTRLQKQAAGDYGVLGKSKDLSKYTPSAEPGGSYGVFGDTYAKSLPSNDPILGPLNDIALRNRADQERDDYLAQMEAARSQGYKIFQMDQRGDLQKAILEHGPEALPGELSVGNEAGGGYGIFHDPVVEMANRGLVVNQAEAKKRETNSTANKNNADAGYKIDPGIAASRDAGYLDTQQPVPYGIYDGQINPRDQAALTTADAAKTRADADMIDANNPLKYNRSGGSGGEPVVTVVQPMYPGMPPQVSIKGKAGQMGNYMGGGGVTPSNNMPPALATMQTKGYEVSQSGPNWIVRNAQTGATATYNSAGKKVQ